MKELWDLSHQIYILPFTFMLIVLLVLWMTSFLGVFDINSVDVDVDTDIDLDLDAGVDIDSGLDAPSVSNGGIFEILLSFFNLGKVPVMVALSFLTLFTWVGQMQLNQMFNGEHSKLLGFGFLFAVIPVASILTRYASMPFAKVMELLNHHEEDQDKAVGSICEVLADTDEKTGRARIKTKSAPIDILTYSDKAPIKRGDQALVIRFNASTKRYLIEKFDTI